MGTNKMREQFEAAIVAMKMATGMPEDDAKSFLEVGSNSYISVYTKAAWWAWQASREAVVVELPPKISAHNTTEGGFVRPEAQHYDEAIDDCRAAIEVQGLKVAP